MQYAAFHSIKAYNSYGVDTLFLAPNGELIFTLSASSEPLYHNVS